MSLYGRTDSNDNKSKAGIGIAASAQAKQTIFIDDTEAALAENKARGLNAPGWWSYYTFTDCDGNTRHKAEMLVTIAGPDLNANETQADDAIAADFGITIDSQPASASVAQGSVAQFVVAAVSRPTGGTLSFQWQVSTDAGSTFADSADTGEVVSGSATNTLDIAGIAGHDANQYRCVVSVTGGADVTSDAATLTVT